jgi:site-specific DNA recombinase
MTAPVRAALYLRVSTGRQAENDLSIPDQRRQAKGYCTSRGWEIAADYVEPGVSATDDRRPEFQRMIDAATTKPPAFDVILVHSFSRFFRGLNSTCAASPRTAYGSCRSPRSSATTR